MDAGGVSGGRQRRSPLFATENPRRLATAAYRLYAGTVFAGILLIWLYRATHLPPSGGVRRWAWLGMLAAELWFGFYWVLTLSVRWSPIYRRTFKDRLAQSYNEDQLPSVDIFVCTADPAAEPPMLVISTVLSVMAYDYLPEKLNIYLSDDAGSELTFYALCEASEFAKHWIPFCNKYKVEPRSPIAYFAGVTSPPDICGPKEWFAMKELYKDLTDRVNSVVTSGRIPEVLRSNIRGFSQWDEKITSSDHPSIVQILIDGNKQKAVDIDGNACPTLVYMAREKRPQEQHHFKAGSLNALIRVSSVISNSPIIMNVDCDMYSNNSESIRDALCFFLDVEQGQDIGFVQYPQNFENVVHNDIYGNPINVVNEVSIGVECVTMALDASIGERPYVDEFIVQNIRKIGLGWQGEKKMPVSWKEWPGHLLLAHMNTTPSGELRSVYYNPERKGFLGMASTSLGQILVQHKRWTEGFLQISLSRYSPFLLGCGKIKLGLQMGYSVCGFWALNSFPTLYYVTIPSLCFINGISLFPERTSHWFKPFAYVVVAAYSCSLAESLQCGDSAVEWWDAQRMWLIRRTTSYLLATIDMIRRLLGISESGFTLTVKVSDLQALERYKKGMMEFGSFSPMFVILTTVALLNLTCMVLGISRFLLQEGAGGFETLFLQAVLCVLIVAINLPVYEALFIRRDKGSLPTSVAHVSICFMLPLCVLSIWK
uniref:Glycosyltransferase 2-like domain-containing protein n=1 Tax=Leersia perrieri TaxID=77586 RepID=A0A0D9VKG1_9ORYZ